MAHSRTRINSTCILLRSLWIFLVIGSVMCIVGFCVYRNIPGAPIYYLAIGIAGAMLVGISAVSLSCYCIFYISLGCIESYLEAEELTRETHRESSTSLSEIGEGSPRADLNCSSGVSGVIMRTPPAYTSCVISDASSAYSFGAQDESGDRRSDDLPSAGLDDSGSAGSGCAVSRAHVHHSLN